MREEQIHICKCDISTLSKKELANIYSCLNNNEQQHAKNYRVIADQNRFCVGRAMLRRLAGEYLSVPANDIIIKKDKFGKPYFRDFSDSLTFNISHSGDWVVVALAAGGAIGVDVQKIDTSDKFDYHNVAKYSFHMDEVMLVNSQSDQEQRRKFFQIWSQKEAVIKALGKGFYEDTTKFSILPMVEQDKWNNSLAQVVVKELDFGPGYTGAVAVDKEGLVNYSSFPENGEGAYIL